MDAHSKHTVSDATPIANGLAHESPIAMDEEDRRYDDTSEGTDWDEIAIATQEEWDAGRYKTFDPVAYPTKGAFIEALKQWMDSFLRPHAK